MPEKIPGGKDELRQHFQAMQEVMRQSAGAEAGLRWAELKRLWPFLAQHRRRMALAVAATVGVSLVTLPIPLLIRQVVDSVLPARDVRLLVTVILILAALQVARMVVSFAASYSFSVLNQQVLVSIKQSLFRHLLRLPLAFFNRTQSSYLMARLSEVQGMGLLFSSSLVMLAIGVLEFILSLAVMLMLSWRLTLVALLLLPVIFRITQRTSHGLRLTSRQVYERGAQVTRQVQEALAGVRTVKTFATEEREAQKVEGSLRQFLRSGIIQSVVSSLAGELVTFSSAIVGFVVLGVSALEIMSGRFTLGDYLAFSAYMVKLHAPVQLLASVGLTLQPGMVALRRVLELFDRIAEEDGPDRLRVERLAGEIAFEEVEFGYDEQPHVLRGASFRVGAGERIALIGASGAGKTTIAQLLLGLYQPSGGVIRYDGEELSSLSLNRLRERIGVVSQDVFLFNDTVRNNIRYSREGASDDDVVRAARLADAHEFICELPAGYETVVGEQGVVLSGGQRQRLSIARAILKDPDVILLDEATSHLDPESEERICQALLRSFADKTLIVIGHRLSTVRKLGIDRVYEVADGRLRELPDFSAAGEPEPMEAQRAEAVAAAAVV